LPTEAGSHRIGSHVFADYGEMLVSFDDSCVESVLKEVADSIVTPVEALGVEEVQAMHALRKRQPLGLDNEVEVVVEKAVDPTQPAETPDDVSQLTHERTTIEVVVNDVDLAGPPDGDVVDAVREQLSGTPGHFSSVRRTEPGRPRLAALGTKSTHVPSALGRTSEGQSLGHVPGTVPRPCPRGCL
jgi:hypothetical protein